MNRFQKCCMRKAKLMKKNNEPDGSIFDISDTSTYCLYKAHMTMHNKTNLQKLLAEEEKEKNKWKY